MFNLNMKNKWVDSYNADIVAQIGQVMPSKGLCLFRKLDQIEDGTNNGITFTTAGGVPCAYMNGSGYCYYQPDDTLSTGSGPLTIAAWLYNVTGSINQIAGYGTNASYRMVYLSTSSGGHGACFYNADFWEIPRLTDTWQHVAVTYDGSNVITWNNGVKYATHTGHTFNIPSSNIYVGGKFGSSQCPQGYICLLRVYNRALEDKEIAKLASKMA